MADPEMNTDKLISALAADAKERPTSLSLVWYCSTAGAVALAALVCFAMVDVRSDFATAVESWRVLFKFAAAIALAIGAFGLAREISRPEGDWRAWRLTLALAPALLLAGVAIELAVAPVDGWLARALGHNSLTCMISILLIGIGPLVLLLLAVRHGASTKPGLAGVIAGLTAGGIAAGLYASHCTDDSPFFVALWYSLSVAGLAGIGAIAGRYFARW